MPPAGVDVDQTIANLRERAELLERITDIPEHLGQEIERLRA